MISDRLLEISKYVNNNESLIDVGCDHALLDIYLYLNRKNINILAVDISKNSIDKAKINLKKFNVENKIRIKRNDGLNDLDLNVDTLIFSGLGGRKISDLLKNHDLKNIKKIIVQPNNNFFEIRKYLTNNGFLIKNESLLLDQRKIYTTILFEKGVKKYSYKQLYFGPILLKEKSDLFLVKIAKEQQEINKIINSLPKTKIIKKLKLKIWVQILKKL